MGEELNTNTPPEGPNERPATTSALLKWLIRNGLSILIMVAILIASSGRPDWVMAWLYTGLYLGMLAIDVLIILPNNPGLIAERSRIGEGTKAWDKVLAPLAAVWALMGLWLVAGLDMRFGWSREIPLLLQIAGLAVAALGALLTSWAMASNKFFSAVVRIQKERGHTVATGGPYQYVRHPGYVGAIMHHLATPLLLGSLWALIPGGLAALLVVLRTALEDRTLQGELDGYKDYAERVRHRLLPAIW